MFLPEPDGFSFMRVTAQRQPECLGESVETQADERCARPRLGAVSGPRVFAVDGLVIGTGCRFPDRAEIDDFGFKAFDFEPQRAAAGE